MALLAVGGRPGEPRADWPRVRRTSAPLDRGLAVHGLEHGAVVVWYQPELQAAPAPARRRPNGAAALPRILLEQRRQTRGSDVVQPRSAAVVAALVAAWRLRPTIKLRRDDVRIAASPDEVFGRLRDRMLGGGKVLAGDRRRAVVRFSGRAGPFRYRTVEDVQFSGTTVTFRHLQGPFHRCEEALHVEARCWRRHDDRSRGRAGHARRLVWMGLRCRCGPARVRASRRRPPPAALGCRSFGLRLPYGPVSAPRSRTVEG